MMKYLAILFVISCSLTLSSAFPYGFRNNFRSYRGGYGFGDIGGTYSGFPGFGGAYGAFPGYAAAHHHHPTINYHHHAQPYYYGGGRGFLGNLLSGSTLPTSKLLIHDTVIYLFSHF